MVINSLVVVVLVKLVLRAEYHKSVFASYITTAHKKLMVWVRLAYCMNQTESQNTRDAAEAGRLKRFLKNCKTSTLCPWFILKDTSPYCQILPHLSLFLFPGNLLPNI